MKLTKLKTLILSGTNKLTDVGALAGLTQLKKLYLSNNQLTDLSPLAKLTQLEQLYLSNNQITDLIPVAGLSKLTHLDLGNNPNLTQTEVDKLRKALPKCEIKHNAKE